MQLIATLSRNGAEHKTTIKTIVPLPNPAAPPNSTSHPNAYRDVTQGTRVLAVYPDTSSFYYGVVAKASVRKGKYGIHFEDDGTEFKEVLYEHVWEVGRKL